MATITKDDELCSFDVPDTTRQGNGPTMYKIVLQVTPKELTQNSYQFVYWRRYSDIRKLYEILHRYHQAIYRPGKFPDFPDRSRFMERFNPVIIEQRRVATKEFLNYVLQHLYLRTHDAYLNFFQNGEKIVLPDVETATLKPEKVMSPSETSNENIPAMLSIPISSVPANEQSTISNDNELLLTTEETEQIQNITNNCAHILEELHDLNFEQQQELKQENEEFNIIKEEIDQAASKISMR